MTLPDSPTQARLAALAASHDDQLRRFLISRVRNRSDVSDIVQEIYLRVLRVPHFDAIRSLEAYVFTVARHALREHFLRQSGTPRHVDFSQLLNPPAAPPDSDPMLATMAQQRIEKLQQGFNRLPAQARAAFIMHRRDGMSLDEIAAQLSISRAMVKKHILVALTQLRLKLEP